MDPRFLAFVGLAALLTVTPGADMALVARNALAGGRAESFFTTLGICAGCLVHGIGSAFGISAILRRSALAFETLKLAGASYLIYLGSRSLWSALKRRAVGAPGESAAHNRAQSPFRSFTEGFLTNLLNPKVALFYLSVLPQFLLSGQPALPRALLLAGVHIAMGFVWLSLYGAFISRLGGALSRPAVRRKLEAATGTLLAGLGVRLALERR